MPPDDAPVVEATQLSYAARWEEARTFERTVTLEAHRRGLCAAAEVASPDFAAAVWRNRASPVPWAKRRPLSTPRTG